LPVAEAMLAGIPVISVRHGVLGEFVSGDTACVMASHPEPSRTRVSSEGSLRFEPDVYGTVRNLLACYREGKKDDVWTKRKSNAQSLVASKHSRDVVALAQSLVASKHSRDVVALR
jgi:hypothetical protein